MLHKVYEVLSVCEVTDDSKDLANVFDTGANISVEFFLDLANLFGFNRQQFLL